MRKIGSMKQWNETFLNELRARRRAERNAELERRLETQRTTEEMFSVLRGLDGINVAEREVMQKKELVAF